MYSRFFHILLAAVTRYATGLVYSVGIDPEKELELLMKLLMQAYTVTKQ